ncbi:unnamed protein product, partial [Symbiodinium sp. CCMP2456]
MNKKDHSEAEAVKGSVELQKMPEPGDAAVEFNDWMYVTEQMLGALTDNASAWFGQCLQCAREAYVKYQNASALERLSISPDLTDSLKDPKWFRLERRVLSLLLAAMPRAVKEDTITHRIESVAGVLYRLHVIYQPGGALERTAILKHLEGTVGPEDPGEVVAQLRRWRRHLARAEEMAIALPDASLQLKGLEAITFKALERLPDVKFRLALAKNELRLASSPTAETVLKYYQHLLAELQQAIPNNKPDHAKLKGATTASNTGQGLIESSGAGPVEPRGTDNKNAQQPLGEVQQPPAETGTAGAQAQPEAASSSSSASMAATEAATQREEMKKLLREASSMLSKIQLMTMKVEDTNKAAEDLELLLRSAGMDQHGLALLDSGASHPFRSPVDTNELEAANNVGVELADGQMVELKQTNTGTLLKAKSETTQAPIVPLGALVQQLGCSISWSKRQGLRVVHPEHGDLQVKMRGTCPYISELEALKLIAEIEDKNLERLQQTTMRSLWTTSSSSSPLPWSAYLEAYVETGRRSSALAAMMDPSFPLNLETVTDRFSFVGSEDINLSDDAGFGYLKSLPVNRKFRRRLHGSRWIVHLYDGKNETASHELKKFETEDIVVLEIDLQRSKMYNLKGWNNVLRALMWAGCRGQLEGILGGPPRREGDELRRKLMYTWMVAEKGAAVNNLKKPFLFMEYPGEMAWWKSDEWRNFRDEYQLSHVSLEAGQGQVFHAATNMNFVNHVKEPRVEKGVSTKWTTSLLRAVRDGMLEWNKWPDQVRQAQLLCKMEGRLEDMSEKELKQWAKHVRDGHVPFNKRTRGIDADGKYRYALVGSYCMPRLEGYKDVDIPLELPK